MGVVLSTEVFQVLKCFNYVSQLFICTVGTLLLQQRLCLESVTCLQRTHSNCWRNDDSDTNVKQW